MASRRSSEGGGFLVAEGILVVTAAGSLLSHLGAAGTVAIILVLGLVSGFLGARLTRGRRRPRAARGARKQAVPQPRRQGSPKPGVRAGVRAQSKQRVLSGECLEGGPAHGECSGVGCDCRCGHPGKAKSKPRTETQPSPGDTDDNEEIPPF